jgi:hypothetical protein
MDAAAAAAAAAEQLAALQEADEPVHLPGKAPNAALHHSKAIRRRSAPTWPPPHPAGLAASWPAVRLWGGPSGLNRLIDLAGEAQVQVMLSSEASGRFVGDMEHLRLLPATLADFLTGALARELLAAPGAPRGAAASRLRLYLAQSPICAAAPAPAAGGDEEGLQPGPLHALLRDLEVPAALRGAPLAQINLWASPAPTRSSLHYDPYANLLCLVQGAKTVRLAPPAATPRLRPQPAFHESANHAAADLWDDAPGGAGPARDVLEFELLPGDALLIPEGWWHQVQSAGGTLAINFWWQTPVARRFGGPADAYYLRRLAQSLAERRRQAALDDELAAAPHEGLNEAGRRHVLRHGAPPPQAGHFLDLGDGAAAVERQLSGAEAAAVELLAERLLPPPSGGVAVVAVAGAARLDPRSEALSEVQQVLFALAARSFESLVRALLTLRARHPAAAAALLLRGAGPAGWELLTSGLERYQAALTQQGVPRAEELLAQVYDQLYSAVPDRQALLQVMLRAKQARGEAAMRGAVEDALQLGM